jgi:hypothetical protein
MRTALVAALLLATIGASAPPSSTYVVSPKATDETKAAVAAGRPPEHGFPAIIDVAWTSTKIKPGSTLEATATTSPNVGYVEGRYKDWNMPFERVGLGKFRLAYKVPFLPPFLIGNWKIDVVARSVDGVEVRRRFAFSYGYF